MLSLGSEDIGHPGYFFEVLVEAHLLLPLRSVDDITIYFLAAWLRFYSLLIV